MSRSPAFGGISGVAPIEPRARKESPASRASKGQSPSTARMGHHGSTVKVTPFLHSTICSMASFNAF